ncbi:hypothetical protein NP233_g3810 [Leucocoprinus birnbaumii]|uniref:Uncharacterized protein n=1 Tax=Leucocoprinus birnbaumii TaxID=56174 RepID=A0AAD5VXA2_9AGAR|nr:hypothetical protein NP233_g3810 [Leucocoprinus birnbaumii]
MIYDPTTAAYLKPWLVRTLEPICDAEPGALADYILALLKHNVSELEMRKELAVQLDEFLEKECPPFVDTLFTVLRTKSYLPYAADSESSQPMDSGIPIPLDLITPDSDGDRSRKRNMEGDERDGRPPAKGARLNSEGQSSRYGNGGRSGGQWDGRGEEGRGHGYSNGGMDGFNMHMMAGMGHMNGGRRPQSYQPPDQKRGICRDYHNNGYCARGMMCKYSHGDDAMVPGQLYPMPHGMPFMPMFPGAMPFGGAYDPNDSRMDMRPRHQRAPILPRQEDGGVVRASGELPVIQDLTPVVPKGSTEISSSDDQTQKTQSTSVAESGDQSQSSQPSQQMDATFDPQAFSGMPLMHPMNFMPMQQTDMGISGGHRGGYRGRGRGRGRGTFGGDAHNFRPERRDGKTLVVEKIPDDKLSLENVNEWFKRFGTVTNVAIDKSGGKALVSFSSHDEAHAAWKSEDAVFNNRFVKVFWHRPMEGQGQVGARMLAASANAIASMTTKPNATPTPPIPSSSSTTSTATKAPVVPATTNTTASALAAKQQLLEQQIAEQKSLMASLGTATPEEKKNIMARLRKLGEEMKATPTPSPAPNSQKSTPVVDEKDKKERERLDKELELHGTSAPSAPAVAASEKQETAEELKAKLEKLKAEAASLGLDTGATSGDWHGGVPSYRGGYRGRARGRGFFRGAPRGGAAPRFNMTLDNRPKKIVLKGAKSEQIQAVKDWYETTGQLESVESLESGDIIVSFKTRAGAEQGLAKGQDIATVGRVPLTWYTGKPATSTTSAPVTTNKVTSTASTTGETQGDVRPQTPELEPEAEEEMVARGWGGDDDGDGMGML